MKLKYYLRGLGVGIIVTAIVMTIANAGRGKPLTDEEIMERAEQLGMTRQKSGSEAEGGTIDHLTSGEEGEDSQSGEEEGQSDGSGAEEPSKEDAGTDDAGSQKEGGSDAAASDQNDEGSAAASDQNDEGSAAASDQKNGESKAATDQTVEGNKEVSGKESEKEKDEEAVADQNSHSRPVSLAAGRVFAERAYAVMDTSTGNQQNDQSGENTGDSVSGSLSASNQESKDGGADASPAGNHDSQDRKASNGADAAKDGTPSGDTDAAKDDASKNGKTTDSKAADEKENEDGKESDQEQEAAGENVQKQVNQSNGASYVTIEVAKGEYSDRVSQKLKEAGVLSDASDFNNYLVSNELDGKISIGTYQIPKGASYKEIAAILCPRAEKTP